MCWKEWAMAAAAAGALSAPMLAHGQGTQNGGFVGRETRELVAICSVGSQDPGYFDARAFCHGYLTGAYWDCSEFCVLALH